MVHEKANSTNRQKSKREGRCNKSQQKAYIWVEVRDDGEYYYQGVKFSQYCETHTDVTDLYKGMILCVVGSMEKRFANLMALPIFEQEVLLLDMLS